MEGPPYMLSPSLHLGAISRLWGNQLLQNIEANTQSPDIHIFFQFWYHSIPSSLNFCQPPIQLFLVLWDHPLPAATPWHSIQLLRLFSFSRNLHFWQCCPCTPILDTLGCCHNRFPWIRKGTWDKSDLAQPPGQALSHRVSDSDGG